MDEKENNLEEFHSKINHKPVEKKKKMYQQINI